MKFESERYGRYEIKSGALAGGWAASAILRGSMVARGSGASREEAIADVKAKADELERLDQSDRDDDGAPSAKTYAEAFAHLLPDMPVSYVAMLRAHVAAPDRLISATRLAQAAGYSGYEGANLHFGLLGQRVANEIGFDPPRRDDGTEIWTCAIARAPFSDAEFPDTSMLDAMSRNFDVRHFEWQMRPQVVDALRALGFQPTS